MPKVFCPKFNGENPVIWKDKCVDYFLLVDLAPQHWVRMAAVHFEGAASQWLQVYRKKVRNPSWVQFVQAVEEKFGKDDYRKALTELLELKQENTVEEYFREFQELQFQVSMHNEGYDDLFFASQFVNGLKEEIRYTVQSQVPETVDRAVLLAKIQQRIVERGKVKNHKQPPLFRAATSYNKPDSKNLTSSNNLWRERQLRDYRKANGLCFFCGDKFDPAHIEVCPKRNKAQIHALALNDLDQTLSEETLNQLAVEDTLTEELYKLSLNAIAGTDTHECIKIRALVKNKIMLILLDSGSSHSFVSSNFVSIAGLPTVPAPPKSVQLPNDKTHSSFS
jgi:hypothetical protein